MKHRKSRIWSGVGAMLALLLAWVCSVGRRAASGISLVFGKQTQAVWYHAPRPHGKRLRLPRQASVRGALTALLLAVLTATAWIAPAQAQFNPSSPPSSVKAYWEADRLSNSVDGSNVTTWADSSASGGHTFSPRVSGQYPVWRNGANGINGNPVVRITAPNGLVTTTFSTPVAQTYTIFAVSKCTTAGYLFDNLTGSGAGRTVVAQGTAGSGSLAGVFAGSAFAIGGSGDASAHLIEISVASGTGTVKVDGTQVATGGVGSNSIDGVALGSVGGNYWAGDIAALLICDSTASTSDLTNIRSYLSTKYFQTAVPGAPTGLMASAGNASVSLTWTAPSSGGTPTAYKIYRTAAGGASGSETLLASPTGTGTSYSDPTAANGSAYYYKVLATNGSGDGTLSNEAGPVTPMAQADFSLSRSPTGTIAVPISGTSSSTTLTITAQNGFSGSVTWTTTGLPSGVTATYGTNPATSTSTLLFSATSGAAAGSYTITVTGTSGGLVHSLNVPITVSLTKTCNVVFHGNSLVAGYANSTGEGLFPNGKDFPSQCMAILPSNWQGRNAGVDGANTPYLITNGANQVDAYYDGTKAYNICVYWELTNHIAGLGAGDSSYYTTAYNSLLTYCAARRAAGWKVLVGTAIPRANIPAGEQAAFESNRLAVNALIRANWKTFCDGIVDIGADGRIGQTGQYTASTYFNADLCHLTDAGYAVMAQYTAAGLLQVATSSTGTTTVRIKTSRQLPRNRF